MFAVDIRIFSFDLILAMDFLNKIAEFMTTGLSEATPALKEDTKVVKSFQDRSVENLAVSYVALTINKMKQF